MVQPEGPQRQRGARCCYCSAAQSPEPTPAPARTAKNEERKSRKNNGSGRYYAKEGIRTWSDRASKPRVTDSARNMRPTVNTARASLVLLYLKSVLVARL